MEINESDKPFVQEDSMMALDPSEHSVTHCVLMQLLSDPDENTLRHHLARVRTRVPGLIELHFGKNNTYKGKNQDPAGNTHAMVSRHVNAAALVAYQKHPDLVALSRFIFSHMSRPPMVVDFVNVPSKL